MLSRVFTIMCVTTVCVVLQCSQAARINITPDGFIEAVTEFVVITCTVDGTSARATEILAMAISKSGEAAIVNIQPPDKIRYGIPNTGHYEVQGTANNSDIPNSYLNLTIIYPSEEDAGTYSCVMSYIDEMGFVKQDTSEADLRLNTSDQSDVAARILNLETALDNLLDRIKDLESDTAELVAENRNLTTQIQLMQEKAGYTVAFSAAVSQEKHIVTGDVLVFSDVITNEGSGYNVSTGIFTAPISGLYAFHLVLEIGQAGAVGEICLNVTGNSVVKMYLQDKDFGDQGAVSTVNRLKAGDTVKVVVFMASGSNPRVFSERLCVFSGYFIKP